MSATMYNSKDETFNRRLSNIGECLKSKQKKKKESRQEQIKQEDKRASSKQCTWVEQGVKSDNLCLNPWVFHSTDP